MDNRRGYDAVFKIMVDIICWLLYLAGVATTTENARQVIGNVIHKMKIYYLSRTC